MGRRGLIERRGRDQSKNIHEGSMDMDNGVNIDCEAGGRVGGEGQREKTRDNYNSINNKT